MLVAERPAPGEPRPYSFPSFDRNRLDNGLEVIVCPVPGRPVAAAHLLLEAGAFLEDPAAGGVASLAAQALTEGTAHRGATAFVEAAERVGADIDARAGWEKISIGMRVPAGRFEAALALLAEAALQPAFPAPEVERLRAERLAEIEQEHADPSSRASKEFVARIYTADTPYSRDANGVTETVSALERDAIEAHYRRMATPGSATLIIAGDVGDGAMAAAGDLFGSWAAPEPERARASVRDAVAETTVTVLHRPGSVQSNIVMGHLGIARDDPAYAALQILNYGLGGSFSSRINTRLREEKGYTYGSRSGFDARRGRGPFSVAAPVETSVTAPAVAEIMSVLRDVHSGGLRQDEIDFARSFLGAVFAMRFETPDAIAAGIGELVVHQLPDDHFDRFGDELAAVTEEEIGRLAAERIHPDRTAIVIVGDADQIAEPLRAIGAGPVTVVADEA